MPRIIIDYDVEIPAAKVMDAVLAVVKNGKISKAGGVLHYCWGSIFRQEGRGKKKPLIVQTRRKKRDQKSDSFRVTLGDAI